MWNYYVYEVPASTDGKPVTIYRSTGVMMFASFTEFFPIPQAPNDTYDRINTVASIDFPYLSWQAINGADSVNFMSFTFSQPTLMYIAVSPYPFYHPDPYFMFDSQRPFDFLAGDQKPWADYSLIDYQWLQQNVFTMDCKDNNGTDIHFQCPFYWDSSDYIDMGCTRLWATYPIDDPNPFYPRPSLTSWIDTYNDLQLNDKEVYARPHKNRLTLALALMSDHGGGLFYRLDDNPDNLPTCQLKFMGNLGNGNRELMDNTVSISFTKGTLSTTADDVNFALTRMSHWIGEIGALSGQDLNDARFQLDVYQWGLPYKFSSEFIGTLYEPTTRNVTVYTTECLVPNSNDPCCDHFLTFTGRPCLDRDQTLSLIAADSLDSIGEESCHEPKCSTLAVSDFTNVIGEDTLKSCDQLLESSTYVTRRFLTPYQNCKERFMGTYADNPSPCSVDADCPAGTFCNVVTKNCNITMDSRINAFLTCFLNETDTLLLIKTVNNLGESVFQQVGWLSDPTLWKTRYATQDCVDPQGIDNAIQFRKHYVYGSTKASTFCPNFYFFDPYSTVTTRCDNKLNTYYTMHIDPFDKDQATCEAYEQCNWDNTITNSTDCAAAPATAVNGSFCAVCDDAYSCRVVPAATQAACNTQVACFHADGSVTMQANQAACEAIGSCDGYPNATAEPACTAAGFCEDTMYLYNGTIGTCVVPFPEPWRFLECNFAFQKTVYQGCADSKITQANCAANNGTWIMGATDATACAAYGSVCIRPVEEFLAHMYQNTYTFTSQNQADCLASDPAAVYRPMYTWKNYQWRPSNARQGQWMTPQMKQRWAWATTFDFDTLSTDLATAVQDMLRFNSKSYITCRYNKLVDSLRTAACDCYPGSTATNCFASSAGLTSSVTELCAGVDFTFLAPPARLTLNPETLSPFGACLYSEAKIFSSLEFKSKETKSTATFFIDFSEATDFSFRNAKGALVGQIVGNGVSFKASTNPQGVVVLHEGLLCVDRDQSIPTLNANYKTLDFASYNTKTKKFHPLVVDAVEDEAGRVCANFTFAFDTEYFPCIRLDDWETATRAPFTLPEFILIIILVALYGIVIIGLIAKLHPLFVLRAFPFGVGVTIPLIVLLVLRLLYFALLIGGAINLNQHNVGIFVIVEIPILFYLSCAAYFVINWVFLTRVTKHFREGKNLRKNIIKYFIGFNVAIAVIFVAFIIAFALIRADPKELCDGKIVEVDQSGPRILSIVYRIYTAALCLGVCILFVIFGRVVLQSMIAMQKRTQGHSDAAHSHNTKIAVARRKMTAVAATSVFSLLLEAVFMIAIAFIPNYHNNILSMVIMVIAEIVPSIAIIVMIDVPALTKTGATTRASMATQNTTRSMYAQPTSSTETGQGTETAQASGTQASSTSVSD